MAWDGSFFYTVKRATEDALQIPKADDPVIPASPGLSSS